MMSNTLEVDLRQIVIGSCLTCPICDPQGILLLAAGHEFTETHRDNILARGIARVRINKADLDKTAGITGTFRADKEFQQLEQSLNQRLDGMVLTGAFDPATCKGPVKHAALRHGTRKFDSSHHQHIQNQHATATQAVNEIHDSVKAGLPVKASQIGATAEEFLKNLVADIACCLYVAGMKRRLATISDHSVNVAILGMAIGFEMGLDVENLRVVGVTGLLEDLGMSLVPESIRNCPRQLTNVEFLEIQRHTMHTANLLQGVSGLPPRVQLIAYQVHERPDGSGYPRGLSGSRVHPYARILHVADMYTSLTARRPFRRPLRPYSAMECLIRTAHQGKVDQAVVRHLLALQSLFPIGSNVRLSDGTVARVIRANRDDYTRPVVMRQSAQPRTDAADPENEEVIDLAHSELTIVDSIPDREADEQELTTEVLGWSKRSVNSLARELVD